MLLKNIHTILFHSIWGAPVFARLKRISFFPSQPHPWMTQQRLRTQLAEMKFSAHHGGGGRRGKIPANQVYYVHVCMLWHGSYRSAQKGAKKFNHICSRTLSVAIRNSFTVCFLAGWYGKKNLHFCHFKKVNFSLLFPSNVLSENCQCYWISSVIGHSRKYNKVFCQRPQSPNSLIRGRFLK